MKQLLFALAIVALLAGCAQAPEETVKQNSPAQPTQNEVPRADNEVPVPVRPVPGKEATNLESALAKAALPTPDGIQEDGRGFAVSPGPEGRDDRLRAAFKVKASRTEVAEFFKKNVGLEVLNKDGGTQLAGKTSNSSDVLIKLTDEEGLTAVEIRAVIHK